MQLRVVSWNVDNRPTGLLDAKLELLRELRPDIALLQELSRSVYRTLLPNPAAHERMHRQARLFAWGALSTDLCRPKGGEHRLGCAVLGAPTTALLRSGLLDAERFDVDEPVQHVLLRRSVLAQAAIPGGSSITACSLQGRQAKRGPAVAYRRAFHAGIAGWLADVSGSALLGMDAQAPEVDLPDPGRLPDLGDDPLLGPDARHGLDDVFHRHLHGKVDELERIRAARPGGPLAVSHLVRAQPVRYDHIWATRDLEVVDVRYLYDEAVAAGSDHALVVADFEV